jgi:hypothetical protein
MTELEELFDVFTTKQEAERFMSYLEELGPKSLGLGEGAFRFGVGTDAVNYFAKTKSVQALSLLKEKFKSTPSVSLRLAFRPKDSFLKSVKGWFDENAGMSVLIDLSVDPRIIGGAVIIANNHYRDYSVLSQIQPLIGKPKTMNR